jgi:hypothetical protein
MIKWITFALIIFVSCILGVLGEFLKWPEKKLFFDLFFALYFSTCWRFIWRQIYMTYLSIVVFTTNYQLVVFNLNLYEFRPHERHWQFSYDEEKKNFSNSSHFQMGDDQIRRGQEMSSYTLIDLSALLDHPLAITVSLEQSNSLK